MELKLNNKLYDVALSITDEDHEEGLMANSRLPENEGMLFVFDEPREVSMWMKDTMIPLSIVFFDEDKKVIGVHKGKPDTEDLMTEDNTKYVLEINPTDEIKKGDVAEFELPEEVGEDEDQDDPEYTLVIVGENGKAQGEVKSGARIFSRKNTKTLMALAHRAKATKSKSDYSRLATKMFEYMQSQDDRGDVYIEN